MTGGDAILRSLEAEGVDVMFGIPGGAIMPTYDAMARGTAVRHVLARHAFGAFGRLLAIEDRREQRRGRRAEHHVGA